jgi:hypothetical protein
MVLLSRENTKDEKTGHKQRRILPSGTIQISFSTALDAKWAFLNIFVKGTKSFGAVLTEIPSKENRVDEIFYKAQPVGLLRLVNRKQKSAPASLGRRPHKTRTGDNSVQAYRNTLQFAPQVKSHSANKSVLLVC